MWNSTKVCECRGSALTLFLTLFKLLVFILLLCLYFVLYLYYTIILLIIPSTFLHLFLLIWPSFFFYSFIYSFISYVLFFSFLFLCCFHFSSFPSFLFFISSLLSFVSFLVCELKCQLNPAQVSSGKHACACIYCTVYCISAIQWRRWIDQWSANSLQAPRCDMIGWDRSCVT